MTPVEPSQSKPFSSTPIYIGNIVFNMEALTQNEDAQAYC